MSCDTLVSIVSVVLSGTTHIDEAHTFPLGVSYGFIISLVYGTLRNLQQCEKPSSGRARKCRAAALLHKAFPGNLLLCSRPLHAMAVKHMAPACTWHGNMFAARCKHAHKKASH